MASRMAADAVVVTADPDQHYPIIVDRQLFRLNDLGLQIIEGVIIEVKQAFERPIGLLPLALADH